MMERTTVNVRAYRVIAHPEDSWWVVEVPELNTAGQAASRAGVEDAARQVVASWLDRDEADVHVQIEYFDEGRGGRVS